MCVSLSLSLPLSLSLSLSIYIYIYILLSSNYTRCKLAKGNDSFNIYTINSFFFFSSSEQKVQDFRSFSLRRGSKLTRLHLSYIFVHAFSKVTTFLNIISSKFFPNLFALNLNLL